jgi:hypothetical protein
MNSPYSCASCCSVHHGTGNRVPDLVPNSTGYSGNSGQINPPGHNSVTTGQICGSGSTGSTGPTSNSKPNVQEKIIDTPNQLLVGDWKGVMGDSLIKIRFETTNKTNKILAFYSIRNVDPVQPSGYFDQPEVISNMISFDHDKKEILIRDMVGGIFCGWVAEKSLMIFGKSGALGNTILYKV